MSSRNSSLFEKLPSKIHLLVVQQLDEPRDLQNLTKACPGSFGLLFRQYFATIIGPILENAQFPEELSKYIYAIIFAKKNILQIILTSDSYGITILRAQSQGGCTLHCSVLQTAHLRKSSPSRKPSAFSPILLLHYCSQNIPCQINFSLSRRVRSSDYSAPFFASNSTASFSIPHKITRNVTNLGTGRDVI